MRDIDDWMFHFEQQVRGRLRKMFSNDTAELPDAIAQRLQRLAEADIESEAPNSQEKPPR